MADPRRSRLAAERRLCDELRLLLANEVVDERLAGVEVTRVELSADRRSLRLLYLPPGDARSDAKSEERLAAAFDGLRGLVANRAFDVLHRSPPELRFVLDKGARNERRVGEILEELYPEAGASDDR